MRYSVTVLTVGIVATLVACDVFFAATESTPREVFDAFWEDFTELYAYMDEYDFGTPEFSQKFILPDDYTYETSEDILYHHDQAQRNFKVLYEHYDPRVTSSTTWEELYRIFLDFEATLKDLHFTFKTFFGSPDSYNTQHTSSNNPDDYAKNFYHRDGHQDEWEVEIIGTSHAYAWGLIKSNREIGYLHVRELVEEFSAANRLLGNSAWLDKIDEIIADFVRRGVKGLIIDLRGEVRGSISNPQQMAGRMFTERKKAFKMLERNQQGRLVHESFVWVHSKGNTDLAGIPAVLLTNKLVRSGGEFFVLMLKKKENLLHIGEATLGVAGGILERDLPDGTVVRYTSSKSWQLDDSENIISYFREGIAPDEEVVDIDDNGEDEIIRRAIERMEEMISIP